MTDTADRADVLVARDAAVADIRAGEICECGDWRSAHPDDGPCSFNDSDSGHFSAPDCPAYRKRATPTETIQ